MARFSALVGFRFTLAAQHNRALMFSYKIASVQSKSTIVGKFSGSILVEMMKRRDASMLSSPNLCAALG
jgi:hypothetical protein